MLTETDGCVSYCYLIYNYNSRLVGWTPMPRQLRICNKRGKNQGQEVGPTIEFPLNVYIVKKTVTSVCFFIRYILYCFWCWMLNLCIIYIIIIILNTKYFLKITHEVIHYNWTEQWPTYLIWGLLLTMIINKMIWNETLLINTYIFGGWGWRWWQDIDKPNNI